MKIKLINLNIQAALCLSAASALIYEVVATNVLFFYFIKSSYSIATVLSVFLFGLGLGSIVMYLMLHKITDKRSLFGFFQIIIALYSFFVLANLLVIAPQLSAWSLFTACLAILLIPTFFLGAAFPLATSLFIKKDKEIVGLAYASDLCGAIIGALLAGFVFIPLWGNKIAIFLAVAFNLLSCLIVMPRKYKIITLISASLMIAAYLLFVHPVKISSQTATPNNNNSTKQHFLANSPYGTVEVKDNALYIDAHIQCIYNNSGETTEKQLADYALESLSGNRLQTLNIGLGCGGTLAQITGYAGVQADVVEINPMVVQANRQYSDILKNPAINLIVDDGLHYLRNTATNYDSILIDIENPSVAHSSSLYTVEAFKIIHDRLNNNGTFALWEYGSYANNNSHYLDIIYYSLKEDFPYIYHFPGIFLASLQPLKFSQYQPTTPYELNTLDKNTLTPIYLKNLLNND